MSDGAAVALRIRSQVQEEAETPVAQDASPLTRPKPANDPPVERSRQRSFRRSAPDSSCSPSTAAAAAPSASAAADERRHAAARLVAAQRAHATRPAARASSTSASCDGPLPVREQAARGEGRGQSRAGDGARRGSRSRPRSRPRRDGSRRFRGPSHRQQADHRLHVERLREHVEEVDRVRAVAARREAARGRARASAGRTRRRRSRRAGGPRSPRRARARRRSAAGRARSALPLAGASA